MATTRYLVGKLDPCNRCMYVGMCLTCVRVLVATLK